MPRTGHIIAYDIGHTDLLTHVGPMARYVEDLGLLLPIIGGGDWRDPVIVPAPLGEAHDVAVRRLLCQSHTDLSEMHPSIAWTQAQPALAAAEMSALLAEWNIYRSQMLAFMEEYDAILCPASAAPAPKHDDPARLDTSYASAYNLTGWPAVVVRGGTSREGLPIGVQVVARPWREDVALAVAQEIERVTGGWQAPAL